MKFSAIKHFYEKNERWISPATLLLGFIWDNLTLKRIDVLYDNIILLGYLVIAAGCILFINADNAGRLRWKLSGKTTVVLPFFMQFAFGGLFSAFVIFYTRSASLFISWPFLGALTFLLIGNDLFREKYTRLTFHLSIFFAAIFSYSALIVPVILGKIGPSIFIASGLISLALTTIVILVLFYLAAEKVKLHKLMIVSAIGGIYIIFNILYFANVIPPIPLILKESGIYHLVKKINTGDYIVQYEPGPWYRSFTDFNSTFHLLPGNPIYAYSAVFSPTTIDTKIFHRWSYFDETKNKWVEKSIIGFPIVGGRDAGYRGYTFKYDVTPGKWRVDVITERGQILGRMNFEVIKTSFLPELETIIK